MTGFADRHFLRQRCPRLPIHDIFNGNENPFNGDIKYMTGTTYIYRYSGQNSVLLHRYSGMIIVYIEEIKMFSIPYSGHLQRK
jgi:hypothetical protein